MDIIINIYSQPRSHDAIEIEKIKISLNIFKTYMNDEENASMLLKMATIIVFC